MKSSAYETNSQTSYTEWSNENMQSGFLFCLELKVIMVGHVNFAFWGGQILEFHFPTYGFNPLVRGRHNPKIVNAKWTRAIDHVKRYTFIFLMILHLQV